MKKKILKVSMSLLVIVLISFFSIYFIQNKYVINNLDNLFMGADIEKGDLTKIKAVRCNLNIFKPKYAVIHDLFNNISSGFSIYFFDQKIIFDFETERIGGTTIKNTTFPQLLKMVKEDCYQFQQPRGNANDKTINWRWSPAPTADEIAEDKERDRLYEIRRKEEEERWNNLTEEEKQEELEKQKKWEEDQLSGEELDEINRMFKEEGLQP